MAINKVEYIKDSSTSGFAIAGDQKVINKQNAQTIEKDVEEKNTQDLTGGQKRYLNNALEGSDNLNYENSGGNETDLDNNENVENDTRKHSNTGPGAKEGLTTMGSMGAAGAAAGMTGMAFAFAQQQGVSMAQVVMNAWAAPIIGGIDLALAAGATVGVAMFDSSYSERLSEASAVSEYISTIDEYIQNMDIDIQSFVDEIDEGEKAPDVPKEPEVDNNEKLVTLQAELDEAIANGDEERANELRAQIEEIKNGEGAKVPAKNEEQIAAEVVARNSEAHDIDGFTTDVASFLSEGNIYGKFGVINSAALAVCTAGSTFLSVLAWRGANLFNTPLAIAGAAMCVAASATFATATGLMVAKTVNEYKCGASGNNLTNKLGELSSKFGDHDKIAQKLVTKETSEPESPTEEAPVEDSPIPVNDAGVKPLEGSNGNPSSPSPSSVGGTPTTV